MMTRNIHKKKKKSMSITQEADRISNLPGLLIDSILERLPIQDAVRTSILSKQWRYRWTTMPALVFDAEFSEKFAENGAFGRNGLIRVINHVMFFHKGPILKFDLHIPDIVLDGFQEVDQWILLVSRNGVEEFFLANSNHRYQLSSHLFSCLGLRKLHLEQCTLKQPLEFQGFLNLEHLCLLDIDFGANLGGSVMNFPQLKHLIMMECTNAYNFNIKATKLQELIVLSCPEVPLVKFFHSPCLITVSIHSPKPTQGFAQVEKMSLAMMFSDLHNIATIVINGRFLTLYIAENIPKWLPHTIDSLKVLSLMNLNFGDLFQLEAVFCMLRNSPNLEELTVSNDQMGLNDIHFDLKPALYSLDQPLNCLQTVKITSVEGTLVELLFILSLLKHSPNLKKMVIRLQTTIDAHKRHNFAKNVTGFARASANVEIQLERIPPPEYVVPFLS